MKNAAIIAKKLGISTEGKDLLQNISFELPLGNSMAITGASGSGKSILGKIIAGQLSYTSGSLEFNNTSRRLLISQQHDFRNLFPSRSYYQQRYDSNYEDSSPSAEEILYKTLEKEYAGQASSFHYRIKEVTEMLGITHLLKSKLIQLSNGEGKKLQLAQALLLNPALIVLDNPFIGLDNTSRKALHEILNELHKEGIFIIIITEPDEIPDFINSILELEKGKIKNIYNQEEYKTYQSSISTKTSSPIDISILARLNNKQDENFSMALEIKNVTIQYGEKIILNTINWSIQKGERWALTGPNGSGKSTLLSLINGDNPKAYGKEIYLFDKKKGSGESIWDIKKKIGYVSPELHIFYLRNGSHTESMEVSSGSQNLNSYSLPSTTCYEAICSGFHEQVGFSSEIHELEKQEVDLWMELLKISHLKNISLYKTSLGEQRLVLLARALVKNPPLLILDEPCQGLDKAQTNYFKQLVDIICKHFNKTLIYVSHYPEDIPECVTKVLALKNGIISY